MGGNSWNNEDTKKAGLGHDLSITESLCKEIQTVALTLKVNKKGRFPLQWSSKEETKEKFQKLWEIPVLLGKSERNQHVSELKKNISADLGQGGSLQ